MLETLDTQMLFYLAVISCGIVGVCIGLAILAIRGELFSRF